MSYTSTLRAMISLVFVLPTLAQARARYTDAAACLASLTQVSAPDAGELDTLKMVRDLSRAHLAQLPAADPARAEAARIQADIERIAAHPQYDSRGGFAATDVIKGREAILAYADRMADVATDIDGGAIERQGQDKFRFGRLLGRTIPPLAATGLYVLMLRYFRNNDLTLWHAAAALPAGLIYGWVGASQLYHLVGRWRAYFTPARRRAWLTARDKEPLSRHFAQFRDAVDAPTKPYTEFAFDTRLATADFSQLRADPTQAALTLANGSRDLPPQSTRVLIENILYVDPQTDEAYAIVHVRGAHLGQRKKDKAAQGKSRRRRAKGTTYAVSQKRAAAP